MLFMLFAAVVVFWIIAEINCSAAWKLTFDEYELWIFKNDCLPLLHRGLNSELHAICGLLLFFFLLKRYFSMWSTPLSSKTRTLSSLSLDLWPAQHLNVLFFEMSRFPHSSCYVFDTKNHFFPFVIGPSKSTCKIVHIWPICFTVTSAN